MGKEEAPGQNKEYTIIVNGTEEKVTGKELTFLKLIELAFGINQIPPNTVYTATYTRGQSNQQGTMTEGDSVHLHEGMIFNVTGTDKS